MISLFSKSKRFVAPVVVHKPIHQPISILSKIASESKRREKIIADIISKMKVKEGETYECFTEQAREELGIIRVEKICDSYAKYGKADWPEDDHPALITGYSAKTNSRYFLSEGYLKV